MIEKIVKIKEDLRAKIKQFDDHVEVYQKVDYPKTATYYKGKSSALKTVLNGLNKDFPSL